LAKDNLAPSLIKRQRVVKLSFWLVTGFLGDTMFKRNINILPKKTEERGSSEP